MVTGVKRLRVNALFECGLGKLFKVYLYPPPSPKKKNIFYIFFLCEKGHSLEVHCTNIQRKRFIIKYEIIHFNVKGLRGDYPIVPQ